MMPLRRLGRTGLQVSACTIGTARMTASDSDPAQVVATIARALDLGVTTFEIDAADTTTAGFLGEVFRRERATSRVQVFARATSLVPFDLPSPHVHAQQAYPGHHLRAETDALLSLLGVDRLAILQLHAWCPEWLGEGDWHDTLVQLRREGKIAGIGISLFDHDIDPALPTIASGAIDTVQVMYNVFDPAAATALLPLCITHDVGVIARSPLYYGVLVDPTDRPPGFAADDWRADYFYSGHRRETDARVRRLADDIEGIDGVTRTALRFTASHPAIATVATGLRTRAHLDAALAAVRAGPLSGESQVTLCSHRWLC